MIKHVLIFIILTMMSGLVHAKSGHKISRPVTTSMSIEDEDEDKNRLVLNFETDQYDYQATQYASPMITFSSHGWDIGLTSQNVLLTRNAPADSGTAQNFENDTYLNINKTFKYKDYFKNSWFIRNLSTTFGTQNGFVIPMSSSVDPNKLNHNTLHQFYFIDTDLELIKNRLSIHIGPYWANKALTTTTDVVDFETGFEAIIIPKRLKFNMDYYSGKSNVSGTIFQGTIILNRNAEFFAGYSPATPNSGNYTYWMCGLNLIAIFDK